MVERDWVKSLAYFEIGNIRICWWNGYAIRKKKFESENLEESLGSTDRGYALIEKCLSKGK